MTLHILSRAHSAADCTADCARALADGDAVLLLGDGTYAAIAGSAAIALLHAGGQRITLHAHAGDCAARGLAGRLDACVQAIDDAAFVALAVAHPRSVSWF